MKQNKFIYLIIFSLVFLGFTNGVKAKACIYNDGSLKWTDMEYNQSTGSSCNDAHRGKWANDDAITNAYLQGIEKVCAKKINGSYDYRSTVYSQATANACGDNGYSWKNVSDIIKDVYGLANPTSSSSTGNQNNNTNGAQTPSSNTPSLSTSTDCNIPENICINDKHGTYANGCCSWSVYTPAATNTSDPDGNSAGNGSTTATSGTTGTDTMTVGFDCNDESVKGVINTIKTIYNLLKYATPVILIIMGSIDFAKAVVAGKDDEIEKNKKRFMNRLFIAVLIFLLLSIFQLVTNIISSSGAANSNSWFNCWNQ